MLSSRFLSDAISALRVVFSFFKAAGEASGPVGIRKKDPESSSPSITKISPGKSMDSFVGRQTRVQKVILLIIQVKFALIGRRRTL